MCRQTTVSYNSYGIETVGKEEKYKFIKRWWNKIYLIYSYLEVEMAGLGRVGLVGVVVVLVGAVLVVIHLAPVSLSSLLTYESLFSRLYALVNYGTLSLHNVNGTLSLHDVKRNAQSSRRHTERSVFTTSKGMLSIYTSTERSVFTTSNGTFSLYTSTERSVFSFTTSNGTLSL
jgi:hypothetical protein